MPQDVQFLAYFGHGTHSAKLSFAYLDGLERSQMGHFVTRCFQSGAAKYFDVFKSIRSEAWLSPPAAQPPRDRTEETLLEVAQRIEPDGGMPGQTQEERILASLLAVLLFAKEGHTATAGAFMPHMQRLLSFLDAADLSSFTEDQRALLSEVRRQLAAGSSPPGPWDKLTRSYLSERRVDSARFWDKLQAGARR
jgi:hypothetical protein